MVPQLPGAERPWKKKPQGGGDGLFAETREDAIVTPLATPALQLCFVGDTGMKTEWVRCRHGAGGRAGRGEMGGVRCGGVGCFLQFLLMFIEHDKP